MIGKRIRKNVGNCLLLGALLSASFVQGADTSLEKAEALLSQMTLEEKVGQLVQVTSGWDLTGPVPDYATKLRRAEMIKAGQIVPSEVTVNLLLDAMRASPRDKFLIDGFPRNQENRDAWERTAGYDCDFVLFFDCPEEVMEKRLLSRGETSGRTDDNIESIKKRFKTFVESSVPVVDYYRGLSKVSEVMSDQPPEEVYAQTKAHFAHLA